MSQPLKVSLAFLTILSALTTGCLADEPANNTMRVYIGTYTRGDSKGIYLYDFDTTSGALKQVGVAAETANPSFLALTPDRKHLYAVGEVGEFEGKKTGVVSAFAVDPATGKLSLLNRQSTGGMGPCHVSTDSRARTVFVANYGSGTVASLPIQVDGRLEPAASVIQHEGSGPDRSRQESPHAHGIWPSPDDRFVLACDLGLDKVLVYKHDAGEGTLTPNEPASGSVPPGGGARHAAFSPDGKFLYVINEMGNTMTVFAWDGAAGKLTEVQTLGTLPADFKGKSHTAEVVVHPSGKFVYGSNRGHDSIAVFTVDRQTGKLTAAGHTALGAGNWPRNFNVDPSGRWLINAGEKSHTLTVFKIDQGTGALAQAGEPVAAPSPACVVFAPTSN